MKNAFFLFVFCFPLATHKRGHDLSAHAHDEVGQTVVLVVWIVPLTAALVKRP